MVRGRGIIDIRAEYPSNILSVFLPVPDYFCDGDGDGDDTKCDNQTHGK